MKKIIVFLLTAALLSSAAVFAEDVAEQVPVSEGAVESTQRSSVYIKVNATNSELIENEDGTISASVTDENDNPAEIIVSEDTLVLDANGEKAELTDGAEFTAYTLWNKPMVMIYPPRYNADLIVINSELGNVMVDADAYTKDGDRYINNANTLSISAVDSEIVDAQGNDYTGELDGMNLAVFYGASTRSIPAQANAEKIVVLGETDLLPGETYEAEEETPEADDTEESVHEAVSMYAVSVATDITVEDANITASDAEGNPVTFGVTEETLVVDKNGEKTELKDGDSFTAYTVWNKPTTMIYPPHYTPDVIVVDTDETVSVNVDAYTKTEEGYINDANDLVIFTDNSVIVDRDGNEYTGDVDGKDLVVFYTVSTRSLPPQTNPVKVIVLGDSGLGINDVANIEEETPAELAVGDVKVEIMNINDVDMVPVRAVAEALGMPVEWNDLLKAVSVGTAQMGVNFNIGTNLYNKAKMMPIELKSEPILLETTQGGVTYVPVEFFTDVIEGEISEVDGVLTLVYNFGA